MISKQCKRYCKDDISLVENYDKAIADHTQMWECHHRDEIKTLPSGIVVYRSAADLKASGRYWKCPANELIFLTESEHMLLHGQNPKSRMKISNSLTGKPSVKKGKPGHSAYNKGINQSSEVKQKIRDTLLAKSYWYKKYGIGYVQLQKIVHLGKDKILELDKTNRLGELLHGQC